MDTLPYLRHACVAHQAGAAVRPGRARQRRTGQQASLGSAESRLLSLAWDILHCQIGILPEIPDKIKETRLRHN